MLRTANCKVFVILDYCTCNYVKHGQAVQYCCRLQLQNVNKFVSPLQVRAIIFILYKVFVFEYYR